MFDPRSRYYPIATSTVTLTGADGTSRVVPYKRRRFLPMDPAPTLLEYTVADGDRLDNLAARYLNDPLLFWQICDANGAMRPDELTAEPGRVLSITLPAGTTRTG